MEPDYIQLVQGQNAQPYYCNDYSCKNKNKCKRSTVSMTIPEVNVLMSHGEVFISQRYDGICELFI